MWWRFTNLSGRKVMEISVKLCGREKRWWRFLKCRNLWGFLLKYFGDFNFKRCLWKNFTVFISDFFENWYTYTTLLKYLKNIFNNIWMIVIIQTPVKSFCKLHIRWNYSLIHILGRYFHKIGDFETFKHGKREHQTLFIL